VTQAPEERRSRLARAARRTAGVAAVFFLVILGEMAVEHGTLIVTRLRLMDLEGRGELARLKTELRREASPAKKAKLAEAIRARDLELRRRLLLWQERLPRGALLLAGSAAAVLIGLHVARQLEQTPPQPGHARLTRDAEEESNRRSRWAVLATSALPVLATAAVVGSAVWAERAQTTDGRAATERRAVDPAGQWPRFRGPGGLGIAASAEYPTKWDGPSAAGLLWRTPVPLPGESSPVVWGDRVFVSGATKDRREVYAFDAKTGALLWTGTVNDVEGTPEKQPEIHEMTGYAAPSCATDGRRVFACFANGNLAAFDVDGKRLWAIQLTVDGPPDNVYGHAASLDVWRDRVIVQMDQGGIDNTKSWIAAFKGESGELLWETPRPVPNTWASPIRIIAGGREQIVAAGVPWVIAYVPATGQEIWRAKCFDDTIELGPSPAFSNNLVFVVNEGSFITAVRASGTGDITRTHVAYQAGENLPSTASPLAAGGLVFTATANYVNCYDAANGKMLWEHEFPAAFTASPTLVGDRVYLPDVKGTTQIFRASRQFERLASPTLGEKVNTCPAFVDGRIYMRGVKHLYCIGERAHEPEASPE
jgi:outer membrane protein assembly factor BamB